MGTFAELQTRVQRRLIDAPASVVAEVPTLINETIREAEDTLNFPVMKATITIVTASSRSLSVLPTDFKTYRGRVNRVSFLGSEYPLTVYQNRFAIQSTIGEASVGGPEGLLETPPDVNGVRSWEVWPTPEGGSDYPGGEYRVTIPYWKYLPDLANGSDSNWFTVQCERWLVAKSTARGMELDWNDQGTINFETIATAEWKKIKTKAILELLQGQDVLIPYQGANDYVDRR